MRSNSDTESLPELLEDATSNASPTSNRLKSGSVTGFFGGLFGRKTKQSLEETYSHSIYESLTSLSSKIMGASTGTGYLTREEFLGSGDYLVKLDSSWEWSFNPEKMLSEFPPDKQYLVNRGLPCFKVKANEERVHLDLKKNELWMVYNEAEDSSDTIHHFYDLSITYDLANATPRIWLFGYNQDGNPLNSTEIIEDMSVEFAGTIATMIPHPVSNILNVSIHPCKHAEVMSRLIIYYKQSLETTFTESRCNDYESSKYLVLFLRLVNHIFPNLVLEIPKIE